MSETLFVDGFDNAILGLNAETNRVVYSKKKMINMLAKQYSEDPDNKDDPEYDPELEAIMFLEYNTFTAYMGVGTPLYNDDDVDEEEIDDCMAITIHNYTPMTKDEIVDCISIGDNSQIKAFELEDKTDNLCNYCNCNYPDCESRIRFGVGDGDDNIIGCDVFQGDISDTFIEEKQYIKEEFNLIYEDNV